MGLRFSGSRRRLLIRYPGVYQRETVLGFSEKVAANLAKFASAPLRAGMDALVAIPRNLLDPGPIPQPFLEAPH